MSTKDLKLKPTDLSPQVWYYEEGRGIHLIVRHPEAADTEMLWITWRKIMGMLKRKDK